MSIVYKCRVEVIDQINFDRCLGWEIPIYKYTQRRWDPYLMSGTLCVELSTSVCRKYSDVPDWHVQLMKLYAKSDLRAAFQIPFHLKQRETHIHFKMNSGQNSKPHSGFCIYTLVSNQQCESLERKLIAI